MATDNSHMVIMGKSLWPLLIGFSFFLADNKDNHKITDGFEIRNLQLTRTIIKAWMSFNFGKIPSPTLELAALERMKNQ